MKTGWMFGVCGIVCLLLAGCSTTASKRAMYKKAPTEAYAGFDSDAHDESKRKSEKVERVKDDAEAEQAVSTLAANLQKERAFAISAEEQLRYWGSKQGVDKLVVKEVRPLLKNPKVEVRAPALRLTLAFGTNEVNGDLIECLADSEYSIRSTAYKALKARTRRDFGFDPIGGEVARSRSVDEWRQWWQVEQHKVAVQPASVYEGKRRSGPKVVKPGEEEDEEMEDSDVDLTSISEPKPRKKGKASEEEELPSDK